jgi:hypothetical protein
MFQQAKTEPRVIFRRGWVLTVVALAITLLASWALAGTFDQLSADDRARLDRGEQVVHTQSMAGSSWPAVTVYQVVAASPEEAAAVFTDFGDHAGYLHDCCGVVQSVVRDAAVGGDPRAQRVFYEISVPVVSNDQYELVEVLSKDGDAYVVSWRKVGSGGHTESILGRARFEPHGDKTLFTYHNAVKMTAFGAGVFSGWAIDRAKTAVGAMGRHIEQVAASGGSALDAHLARLRAALGS